MSKTELNYSEIMPILKKADQDFTEQYGCGAPFQQWDLALENAVNKYNSVNGTSFCSFEARHQYIEQQEGEHEK